MKTSFTSLAVASLSNIAFAGGVQCNNEFFLTSSYFGMPDVFSGSFQHNGFAYVNGEDSARTFDTNDPNNITSHSAPNFWAGIPAVAGSYLYYWEGNHAIYDISDMTNIHSVGSLPESFPEIIKFAYGNALYATSFGSSDLQVFENTNPLSPVPTGNSVPSFVGSDVFVLDNSDMAIGVNRSNGLVDVLDLSNPLDPGRLGQVQLPDGVGRNSNVGVFAGRLYALSDTSQLWIYTISGSGSFLTIESTIDLDAGVDEIKMFNNRIWIADEWTATMMSIDPQTGIPEIVSSLTAGSLPIEDLGGVTLFHNQLPVDDFSGNPQFEINMFDTRTPNRSPVLWSSQETITGGQFVDDRMFLANNTQESIDIYQLTDDAGPALLGSYAPGDETYNIWSIDGTTLYAKINETTRMIILDIQDPTNPTLLNDWENPTQSLPVQATFQGSIGYFANLETLTVFDFTNPLTPINLGQLQLPKGLAPITDIEVSPNGYAAISTIFTGVKIIDISSPSLMSITASIDWAFTDARKIALSGDSMYIDILEQISGNSFEPSVEVYDLSDPTNPTRTAGMRFEEKPTVHGNRIMTSSTDFIPGLRMYDISSSGLPQLLYRFEKSPHPESNWTVLGNNRALTYDGNQLVLLDMGEDCTHCPSDLNLDSERTIDDIFLFLNLYYANDPFADIARDGVFNFFDVSLYLNNFVQPCK